jgi:hypothetical protein
VTVEEIPNFAVLQPGLMLADVSSPARWVMTESGNVLYAKKPVVFVIMLASLRNKIACMTIPLGLWLLHLHNSNRLVCHKSPV